MLHILLISSFYVFTTSDTMSRKNAFQCLAQRGWSFLLPNLSWELLTCEHAYFHNGRVKKWTSQNMSPLNIKIWLLKVWEPIVPWNGRGINQHLSLWKKLFLPPCRIFCLAQCICQLVWIFYIDNIHYFDYQEMCKRCFRLSRGGPYKFLWIPTILKPMQFTSKIL